MTDPTDLQAASLALWAKLGDLDDVDAVRLIGIALERTYRLGENAGLEKACAAIDSEFRLPTLSGPRDLYAQDGKRAIRSLKSQE